MLGGLLCVVGGGMLHAGPDSRPNPEEQLLSRAPHGPLLLPSRLCSPLVCHTCRPYLQLAQARQEVAIMLADARAALLRRRPSDGTAEIIEASMRSLGGGGALGRIAEEAQLPIPAVRGAPRPPPYDRQLPPTPLPCVVAPTTLL